ncbi:C-GCAxxG-C-C family (seleno)protein [Bacteroidota bacterium]
MNTINKKRLKLKPVRTFLKKGTCSRTYFYLLNREYGESMAQEEQALDPLAGGIMQQGYQCGMLWGASMAVGVEAYRRCDDIKIAIALAIVATQKIMKSFEDRATSIECEDITNCDWTSKNSMRKYFFSGRFINCFALAKKWAPEAIEAAYEGLALENTDLPKAASCATELAKKMGASEEEMVMVAGFAGGMGLSGNGCGALAAAMWLNTLSRIKNNTYKIAFPDPALEDMLNKFYETTDYEMECCKITGEKFNSLEEHTEFIKNDGCIKIIDSLANFN